MYACIVRIYFLTDDTQTQSLYNYSYRTYIDNKLSSKSVSHENVQRLSKTQNNLYAQNARKISIFSTVKPILKLLFSMTLF